MKRRLCGFSLGMFYCLGCFLHKNNFLNLSVQVIAMPNHQPAGIFFFVYYVLKVSCWASVFQFLIDWKKISVLCYRIPQALEIKYFLLPKVIYNGRTLYDTILLKSVPHSTLKIPEINLLINNVRSQEHPN